jgi:hypothetical protein
MPSLTISATCVYIHVHACVSVCECVCMRIDVCTCVRYFVYINIHRFMCTVGIVHYGNKKRKFNHIRGSECTYICYRSFL